MALAKRATVHRTDLAPGWRLVRSAPPVPSDLPCKFDPDLSAFVITGKHETSFAHGTGAQLVSDVAVFRSVRDAAGDFTASAKPGFMRCLRRAVLRGLRKARLRGSITSSRMSTSPRVRSAVGLLPRGRNDLSDERRAPLPHVHGLPRIQEGPFAGGPAVHGAPGAGSGSGSSGALGPAPDAVASRT